MRIRILVSTILHLDPNPGSRIREGDPKETNENFKKNLS